MPSGRLQPHQDSLSVISQCWVSECRSRELTRIYVKRPITVRVQLLFAVFLCTSVADEPSFYKTYPGCSGSDGDWRLNSRPGTRFSPVDKKSKLCCFCETIVSSLFSGPRQSSHRIKNAEVVVCNWTYGSFRRTNTVVSSKP